MKKRIRLLTGIIIICCSCVAAGKENTGESEGDDFYSSQTEDTEKALIQAIEECKKSYK